MSPITLMMHKNLLDRVWGVPPERIEAVDINHMRVALRSALECIERHEADLDRIAGQRDKYESLLREEQKRAQARGLLVMRLSGDTLDMDGNPKEVKQAAPVLGRNDG